MGALPSGHTPTSDELLKMVMIDRKRLVKVNIELRDDTGDTVDIRDVIEKLTEYVSDKLKDDEENICRKQIYPMMAQAITAGLIKLSDTYTAAYILSNEMNRYSLIHMMTVGFYLLKWIQQKGLKVHTFEEQITADELAAYERVSSANSLTVQYGAAGGNPEDMIKELLKNGELKPEDLQRLGAEHLLEGEDKEKN